MAQAPVITPHAILFVTQVPVPTDFTTIGSTFGNHRGGVRSAARGGDLWIRAQPRLRLSKPLASRGRQRGCGVTVTTSSPAATSKSVRATRRGFAVPAGS